MSIFVEVEKYGKVGGGWNRESLIFCSVIVLPGCLSRPPFIV
jgi:hypothetical protein